MAVLSHRAEKDLIRHARRYSCRLTPAQDFADPLIDFMRDGARRLLAQAVDAGGPGVFSAHGDLTSGDGRKRLVWHGHLPERTIQTGIDLVGMRRSRVHDRGAAERQLTVSRQQSALCPDAPLPVPNE